MEIVNAAVLERAREVLLNPRVLERALTKLGTRFAEPDDARVTQLETQQARLLAEVERLTAALAAGGALTSLIAAIRERESRLELVRPIP
jgi:hypothetical protein